MTQHHKTEDYKLSAVDYYLTEDKSQEEVCKIFKCSARSLMRWVDKYKKDGQIKRYNRTPIAYKIDKNEVKYILEEIKKNKTITMEDLLVKVKEKYHSFDISRRHLGRVIKDNNITLKITRVRHEPTKRFGKDIDINQKIKEFYEEVKKYKLEDIICIDETSIKSLQKRNHCYNEIGKRCVIKTQSQEVFKKYTGIFAVSTKGVLGWELYEKSGINANRLYEFLETHITNKYKNKLIILDNASSHRNERIKELVNKHNNILYAVPYQHFTNTYQHFTNSIENYFSMLKSQLYKVSEEGQGLTHEKLKVNITSVIRGIPKEKYENIFKGAYDRDAVYVKNKTRKRKLKNYKV
jgi:transposase